MKAGQNDNEIRYLHIARALGIIAVVVGHSGSPLAPYLYLYHLALFFFISGYLFRDADAQEPLQLIKKRLRSLYLPYVGYQLAFLALHNIFLHSYILSIRYDRPYDAEALLLGAGKILLFSGDERLPSAMWFLPSLFFVTIVFAFIRRASLTFVRSAAATFLSVAVLFSLGIMTFRRDIYFFLMLNNILVALPVYYAGQLFRHYEDRVPMHGALAALAITLLIMLSRFGRIDLAGNVYGPAWFFLACSFAGIYANIYIARAISEWHMGNILGRIGKATIVIIALHFLSFKVVSLIQVVLYSRPIFFIGSFPILDGSGGWWVLYAIAGIFVPLLALSAASKVKQACVAYVDRRRPS